MKWSTYETDTQQTKWPTKEKFRSRNEIVNK